MAILPPNSTEGKLDTKAIAKIVSSVEYDDNDILGKKVWSRDDLIFLFSKLDGYGSTPELSKVIYNESNIAEIRNHISSNITTLNNSLTTNVSTLSNRITTLDEGIDDRFVNSTLRVKDIAIGSYTLSDENGELTIKRNDKNSETVIKSDQFKVGDSYKLMTNTDGNITIKSIMDDAEMFTLVRQEIVD
tara:strand:- start:400 stop:966 length:567 start_codon:yes stop_codon:yes gene_type:complete